MLGTGKARDPTVGTAHVKPVPVHQPHLANDRKTANGAALGAAWRQADRPQSFDIADRAVAVRTVGLVQVLLHGSFTWPHVTDAEQIGSTLRAPVGIKVYDGFLDVSAAIRSGSTGVHKVPTTALGNPMERAGLDNEGLSHRRSPPHRTRSCRVPCHGGCGAG